ncbi:SOS response-associated peptidase [cf. Phormidesmis sp. LEGE 11477]|uniref:SOS response-associated peptidase n=1 Tax=cf. Phormidesmis sp. LEGE 11477 TaxID=1828680 RepID=UPI00187EC2C8|nr:SOS response-associated peptidase [cf. Phormidesmis sp. LEGE 11477]MBE9059471.1 SOS response-associated peptidase [cf. Phormidesmis sp. LEGE 11477]
MCARFTLDVEIQQLRDAFELTNSIEIRPTWNRAPGAMSPIVIKDRIGLAKWGLKPTWAKPGMKAPHNARIETAATKPYFRNAWAKRRCLVPATGFYEWQATKTGKQPIYFSYPGQFFAFAGLWEKVNGQKAADEEKANKERAGSKRADEEQADNEVTFTILTQAAIDPVAAIHHRMPVILPPEAYDRWLAGDLATTESVITEQSSPYMQTIAARPVSRTVNNARNDSADLIAENSK